MIYALGAFDGFHLGHRRLLKRAACEAAEIGTGWGVITFEGHPRMLLNKNNFKLLFSPPERDLIARFLAVPKMEKLHFTPQFAALSPSGFIDFIAERFSIDGLVTGANFRFGKNRAGDAAVLETLCREHGWSLSVMPSKRIGDTVISSTAIRNAVSEGRMELASELLGYPYMASGRVMHGEARGRTLGFPTANISVLPGKIYPPAGVYAAVVLVLGEWYPAALNIGSNPTFDGTRQPRCEAHIIGLNEELYGEGLTLFIIRCLREERKFDSAEDLKAQIALDTAECERVGTRYIQSDRTNLMKFASCL